MPSRSVSSAFLPAQHMREAKSDGLLKVPLILISRDTSLPCGYICSFSSVTLLTCSRDFPYLICDVTGGCRYSLKKIHDTIYLSTLFFSLRNFSRISCRDRALSCLIPNLVLTLPRLFALVVLIKTLEKCKSPFQERA